MKSICRELTNLFPLIAAFIVVVMCFVELSPILFFCAEPPSRYPQIVDVEPLANVVIPLDVEDISEVIDLEIFDRVEQYPSPLESGIHVKGTWLDTTESRYRELSGITVELDLSRKLEYAQRYYKGICDTWGVPFEHLDLNVAQSYCISYVVEPRLSPDSLCRPSGHYKSFVAFQKGRLVIIISEISLDAVSLRKDKVIELLADEIERKFYPFPSDDAF